MAITFIEPERQQVRFHVYEGLDATQLPDTVIDWDTHVGEATDFVLVGLHRRSGEVIPTLPDADDYLKTLSDDNSKRFRRAVVYHTALLILLNWSSVKSERAAGVETEFDIPDRDTRIENLQALVERQINTIRRTLGISTLADYKLFTTTQPSIVQTAIINN